MERKEIILTEFNSDLSIKKKTSFNNVKKLRSELKKLDNIIYDISTVLIKGEPVVKPVVETEVETEVKPVV